MESTFTDINSERMVINIKGAKGMKDRISLLSEHLLELLRNYFKIYSRLIGTQQF